MGDAPPAYDIIREEKGGRRFGFLGRTRRDTGGREGDGVIR